MKHRAKSSDGMMDEQMLLAHLEELADRLEIVLRHEKLDTEDVSSAGGMCRIDGRHVIMVHSAATVREQIHVMITALREFDISEIYVRPYIRAVLEGDTDI